MHQAGRVHDHRVSHDQLGRTFFLLQPHPACGQVIHLTQLIVAIPHETFLANAPTREGVEIARRTNLSFTVSNYPRRPPGDERRLRRGGISAASRAAPQISGLYLWGTRHLNWPADLAHGAGLMH